MFSKFYFQKIFDNIDFFFHNLDFLIRYNIVQKVKFTFLKKYFLKLVNKLYFFNFLRTYQTTFK